MPFTYDKNMRAAAFRNLQAGELLDGTDRRDRAGYLYGWAAECGVKALMQALGWQEPPQKERGSPHWAHFPELKQYLRDHDRGRQFVDLKKYTMSRYMEYWHTSMRYSDGKAIRPEWVDRWHEDAKAIVSEI